MNIYDYLKMDHKRIETLFKLLKTAPTEKNKFEIIQLVCNNLLLHADSEASTFYAVLESKTADIKAIMHGEKEHDDIKKQIHDILAEKIFSQALEQKVLELKLLVDHHVAEEENTIFKIAKKVLSEEEAMILKEKMHYQKWKIVNTIKINTNINEKMT